MRHPISFVFLAACGGATYGVNPDATDAATQDTGLPVATDFCDNRGNGVLCDGLIAVTCDGGDILATEACAVACVPGEGCASSESLTVTVPGSSAGTLETTGVVVAIDPSPSPVFAERRPRLRRVDIALVGAVTASWEGDFEVFDAQGAPLTSPLALKTGDHALYIGATTPAAGALVVDAQRIPLTARRDPGLSGRALSEFPWFEQVTVFNDGDTLSVAVDPTRWTDKVGLTVDLYAVPHRSTAAWAADPSLGDAVLTGAATIAAGGIGQNTWNLGVLPAGPEVSSAWDLVLDADRDGTLSPGDLFDGGTEAGAVSVIDLLTPGPYTPTTFEYSTGVWTTMKVYTPEDPAAVGAPMPLVVISHGNGHDYTWYDYLGNHLSSWGYVVIAHTNNTGPGIDTASTTTLQNTEVFLRDLAVLGNGMLNGYVDGNTITWIGHSRGGEGVAHAYNKLVNDIGAQPTTYDEADIALISSIAPTMFQGPTETNPHDRPYQILSGSRDGDVTGGVSPGDVTQYYAIFQGGTGDHLVSYVWGADHNDFNCCGTDDAAWTSGPGEIIGRPRAQAVAKSYYLALLEVYIRGNTDLIEYFQRSPRVFAPMGVDADITGMFREAEGVGYVIDDFQTNQDVGTASSGAVVTTTALDLVEGPLDDANTTFTWMASDPMNGMTWSNGDPSAVAERGAVLTADVGFTLSWALPADHQDTTPYRWLTFRAAQGTRHPRTDSDASFAVTLTDADGISSTVDFGVLGILPLPYGRTGEGDGTGWANEFATVRLRLTDFEADGTGIDLARVASVTFTFGGAAADAQRIALDDLALVP